LRRMILQLRHIFFTDASTFISHLSRAGGSAGAYVSETRPLLPENYFALNVIRARDRS
jgi:hypothetical protein